MTAYRVLVVTLSIFTAVLIQTTVLSRLGFLGAQPDLVLVVIVCFALTDGPGVGMVSGFGAGLLLDLLSDHTLGLLALILCAVGYASGIVRAYLDRLAITTPMLFVGVATAAAGLAFAALLTLLGDPRITAPTVFRSVTLAALYDVVLTPFVFAAVSALSGRRDDLERRVG
ncbi:MAG TPA: rod shape-determining protein MreD [Mycobacteriales bacterium]|nr:rod shape-determining protein MreD [Mycobacteriales bacterium]